jgi:hypothetical protein
MKNYYQYVKENLKNEVDPYGEDNAIVWVAKLVFLHLDSNDNAKYKLEPESVEKSTILPEENRDRITKRFFQNDEYMPFFETEEECKKWCDNIGEIDFWKAIRFSGMISNTFGLSNNENVLNEKLGVADIVYQTAIDIYENYNLEWYQRVKRDHINKAIIIDTKNLKSPFNEMKLVLYFDNKERPKNVRGGIDRIEVNAFNVYIYYTSKNVFRTLAHELDHVYQVFLRKKHFATNKDKTPSPFRKSEESPQMMSVYALLLQKDIKSKKDFIEKLSKLPTYKKYKKILEDEKETPAHKRIAERMIKKMSKLYAFFSEDIKEQKNIKYMGVLNEQDALSGKTTDIKISVQAENKNLLQKLSDDLSLIVKKRKLKNIRIKSIEGYIDKRGVFTHHGVYFETYLDVVLSNKDVIIGEFKSITGNITISVNSEVVYDMNSKIFDSEVLIDKMVNEYVKYLKLSKFAINDNVQVPEKEIPKTKWFRRIL